MRPIVRCAIVAAALTAWAGSQTAIEANAGPARTPHAASSTGDLRTTMRKLWEDHITYTRNYIISALADLADADAVANRLLKNQDNIGDAIKPYYGAEAGKTLSGLLRDHILIATEV